MAFNAEQLRHLNDDFTAVTGQVAQRFVCPITLRDESEAALCDGHILNRSIQAASRKTVVQREDIDNYFGTTLEPDLVAFPNAPVSTGKELMQKYSESLTVLLPSGEKVKAFFASGKARAKFPQIDLLDGTGATVASPFLRTGPLEHKLYKGLQVEWLMGFTNSALLGALVKSAYLALFRLIGYRYVFSPAGDCVRQALARFYQDKGNKANAHAYFSGFNGAFSVVFNDLPPDQRYTVEHGAVWVHCEQGGLDKDRMFAITCLFRVNNRLITIMAPFCLDDELFPSAYAAYEQVLTDWTTPHDIHRASIVKGVMQVETELSRGAQNRPVRGA